MVTQKIKAPLDPPDELLLVAMNGLSDHVAGTSALPPTADIVMPQPSIRRRMIWPQASKAQNNMQAVSAGCGRDAVLLAVERWYDFPEFGGYLGNVGYKDSERWVMR